MNDRWRWIRNRSLVPFFFALWIVFWIGQLITQWHAWASDQVDHGGRVASGMFAFLWHGPPEFWWQFAASSLENYMSEAWITGLMVWATVYLYQRGSPESRPLPDEK